MKITLLSVAVICSIIANSQVMDNTNTSIAPIEQLSLTQEWDKTFPKSDKVDHKK